MLNQDEVNKRADEIVEMFIKITHTIKKADGVNDVKLNAMNIFSDLPLNCAILHVEKIVELLKALANNTIFVHVPPRKALWDLISTNNQILSNLKERIK